MKFKNGIKGTVVGYDLTSTEIKNLLKAQIKMRFIFLSPQDETIQTDTLYLLDRIVDGNIQKINISDVSFATDKEIKESTYSEVLKILQEKLANNIVNVVFSRETLMKKKPLIDIIGDIKPEIINGCVYVDYDNGMFTLMNKSKNNLPNCMYYWEETGSMFIFTEEKPILMYQSKFDNIEEILC